MRDLFRRISHKVSLAVGTPWAFALAFFAVVIWLITGPFFKFSDGWQLVINTGTTIITFLMIFLVQNSQNRDTKATHLKLDELIHAIKDARNVIIDAEDLTDEELEQMKRRLLAISRIEGENKENHEASKDE